MLLELPTSFKERIINTHGGKGELWLRRLPQLIATCEARFDLKVQATVDHLSFNYTARAVQTDGSAVIIKIGVPSNEVECEIHALDLMRGDGIVDLLDSDRELGALVFEQLVPGNMLLTLKSDEEATAAAVEIMQKLWRSPPDEHAFPTTRGWFERLAKPIDFPAMFKHSLIDKAVGVARDLHQDVHESVLLHGDLHHYNILSSHRQSWLAIDPKGVVGESEYEVGALLRNPIPEIATKMDTKKVLARRVDQLTEMLGFDRQKIMGWGFSQAILAAVWSVDGHSDEWQHFLKCAEILASIR